MTKYKTEGLLSTAFFSVPRKSKISKINTKRKRKNLKKSSIKKALFQPKFQNYSKERSSSRKKFPGFKSNKKSMQTRKTSKQQELKKDK